MSPFGCYLLISFGKSANAFNKFFRNDEDPKQNEYDEGGRMEKKVLQWHPAFYAGLQIELEEEKVCVKH